MAEFVTFRLGIGLICLRRKPRRGASTGFRHRLVGDRRSDRWFVR